MAEYGIEVPRWEVFISIHHFRMGKSMAILCVGIDLAKNVFAVHGVDEAGKPALVRPSVLRLGLETARSSEAEPKLVEGTLLHGAG